MLDNKIHMQAKLIHLFPRNNTNKANQEYYCCKYNNHIIEYILYLYAVISTKGINHHFILM